MLQEPIAFIDGFTSYFSFCRKRSGYSGVATYVKDSHLPVKAEEGLAGVLASNSDSVGFYDGIQDELSLDDMKALDSEGRTVITLHQLKENKSLAIINVYCPRADPEKPERKVFKLKFYKLLELRAEALRKAGHFVVIVGDVNCSHRQIDHCDPYEEFEQNPARKWMDHFLHSIDNQQEEQSDEEEDWKIVSSELQNPGGRFVDAFRHFHPGRELAFTCWNTMKNCRSTNYGTRLDYILVCKDMINCLEDCDIDQELLGSDHCPVIANFKDIAAIPASKCPSFCTRFYPEFAGSQQKLSSYFTKEKRKLPIEVDKPVKIPKKSQANIKSFFTASQDKTEHFVDIVQEVDIEKRVKTATAWKSLMKGPPPAPLCKGHSEPSVLRTVKKKGPNCGRQFWCCPRGEGKSDDPKARCDYFKWVK